MKELGVHMIPAYSPQARGRSERNFSTWQGRLPQELRLRGIRTLEGANQFLNDHYIAEFNRRFTVPAAERGTAFISCRHRNLEMVFTQRYERTVDRDNTVTLSQPGHAARARSLAPYPGRMQGDHPSAPGHDTDPHDRRTSHRTLQRGRKAVDAAEQKTNQGRGKDVERKSPNRLSLSTCKSRTLRGIRTFPPPLRLLTYETGHFTCYQKRTFSLANDTSGLGHHPGADQIS